MMVVVMAVMAMAFYAFAVEPTVNYTGDLSDDGTYVYGNISFYQNTGDYQSEGYAYVRCQLMKANADGSGAWSYLGISTLTQLTGYPSTGSATKYANGVCSDQYGWYKYKLSGYGKGYFYTIKIKDPANASEGEYGARSTWEETDVYYPPKVGIHSVSISCNSGTVTISGVAKAMNRTNIDIVLQLQRSLNQSTWSDVSGSKDEELDQSTGEYATWSLSNSTYFPGTDYYYRAKMTITADGGFSATSYSNSIQCR